MNFAGNGLRKTKQSMAFGLLAGLLLSLTGCRPADAKEAEIPAYFNPVIEKVTEAIEQGERMNPEILTEGREQGMTTGSLEGTFYTLTIGQESYSFDLGGVLDQEEDWYFETAGASAAVAVV